MEDFADRYGIHLVKLVDSNSTRKEFEFDQVLLMPTAGCYRSLVEQADIEIPLKTKNYLLKVWSEGTLNNLSYFVMAAAVYARSISDPPYNIDIGEVLTKTVAFCNSKCTHRGKASGSCRAASNKNQHHLPKCMKIPIGIEVILRCLKNYIANGKVISVNDALSAHEAMAVKIDLSPDFAPAASC
jgi:hypothetical protein